MLGSQPWRIGHPSPDLRYFERDMQAFTHVLSAFIGAAFRRDGPLAAKTLLDVVTRFSWACSGDDEDPLGELGKALAKAADAGCPYGDVASSLRSFQMDYLDAKPHNFIKLRHDQRMTAAELDSWIYVNNLSLRISGGGI